MGILIGILIAAAAVILLVAYIVFRRGFVVPREATRDPHRLPEGEPYLSYQVMLHQMIEDTVNLPFEDIYTVTPDGLKLHGRYYETKPGAPFQILFHGYHSSGFRDFSGGLHLALNAGYNVILVDQRAHGWSEGRFLTFGIRESEDVQSWVAYTGERFGKEIPIVLVGISMGAATVMMAGELDLPDTVRAIVADCGYNSPKDIICRVIGNMKLPVGPMWFFTRLGARLYGHFDPESRSPEKAMKRCRLPVLFIHGEMDTFVPCEMSRICYDACVTRKRLETFPGAGHGISYILDRERYARVIREFLIEDEVLKRELYDRRGNL